MRPCGLLAACVPLGFAALTTFSACSSTANISDAYMALDSDGSRKRDTFFTDTKEIHCIAEGAFGRGDVTVDVALHQIRRFDFGENKIVDADRYPTQVEFHPQPQPGAATREKLDLQLQHVDASGKPMDDSPFEVGSYVCEVSLDGELVKSVPFNIDFPECPPSQIVATSVCVGFYKPQDECRRYGVKSEDNAMCTCEATGWKC